MDSMELVRTPDGFVTRLALVRAIRGVTMQGLGRDVFVSPERVLAWENGTEPIPNEAMAKRLGLALRWSWADLLSPAMEHDDAWRSLCTARKAAAGAAEKLG
jgi:hypothetical protein